jgi:hypothetical protein
VPVQALSDTSLPGIAIPKTLETTARTRLLGTAEALARLPGRAGLVVTL